MQAISRAFRNLGRKKFRSLLVIIFLSLVIGIFVTMIQISQASLQRYEELESKIQNTIEIRPIGSLGIGGKRQNPFKFEKTLNKMRSIPHIIKIERYLLKRTFFGEESFEIIIGIDPESALRVVGELEPVDKGITAGRVFNPDEGDKHGAIIGKNIAQSYKLSISSITKSTITLENNEFEIIGMFETGNEFTDSQLFIPFDVFKTLYSPEGVSKFFVTVDNIQNTDGVIERLKVVLPEADIVANEASINLAKSSLQVVGSTTFYASLFFFVVGALLVIFIMILVFRERIKEVGTLKAIGASNWQISKQFMSESILLTLLSGLGGLIISTLSLYFFSLSWTNIQFEIVTSPLTSLLFLKMVLVSLILGMIGSLYPIIRAIRLSPVETSRMK